MLILLGTEEMGSGGRRRRPTVCEELRRRRRRPAVWSSRKDDHFSTATSLTPIEQSAERAYCFKFLFGNVFLHSFVCFFCLLSLGLRRLMILVKLVLIYYFDWFATLSLFLATQLVFHSVGKIAAGFFDDTDWALGEALALKKSSRIYLCNFSFAFGLRNWLLKKSFSNILHA